MLKKVTDYIVDGADLDDRIPMFVPYQSAPTFTGELRRRLPFDDDAALIAAVNTIYAAFRERLRNLSEELQRIAIDTPLDTVNASLECDEVRRLRVKAADERTLYHCFSDYIRTRFDGLCDSA
jgi:hypothetical protein